ncbi:MAG: hypothetical protein IT350_00060 [Deltaproteobacteria bacterium]|nr:hypothetical protein [Deltaproteobacteria bacterium]
MVAALVFALVRAHGSTAFFDRSVGLDEQLNSTMDGRELPTHPTGVRFSFRPRASTPGLRVFWNHERMDGDREALRIGSLPARPSSWIVVRGGRVVETKPVAGAATNVSKAPLWLWNIAALATATCALCAFLAFDRLACRRLLARGCAARWLTGYPLAVVLIPLAFVGFFGAWESAKRTSGDLNWFQPYLRDGVFDDAAFRADPVLRRGGREIRVPLGGDTVVNAAHGGSTTDGYPYGRGRWDWPTRLREKIEADPDFALRSVDVLNLGYVSDLLENNVPPGIAGFYAAARPRVVIFHPVINNYYSRRPTEALAHGLGFWSHRAQDDRSDAALSGFLELLRAKIRLAATPARGR